MIGSPQEYGGHADFGHEWPLRTVGRPRMLNNRRHSFISLTTRCIANVTLRHVRQVGESVHMLRHRPPSLRIEVPRLVPCWNATTHSSFSCPPNGGLRNTKMARSGDAVKARPGDGGRPVG